MDGSEDLWGTLVSEIQSDIAISNAGKITGTLECLAAGHPEWCSDQDAAVGSHIQDTVRIWPHKVDGEGHFLALHVDDIPETATSVLVGLEPSAGSGLQELINDPDKSVVMHIADKNTQKFKLVVTTPTAKLTRTYDLDQLTLEAEPEG